MFNNFIDNNNNNNKLYIAATPFSLRTTIRSGRKPIYFSSFQSKTDLIGIFIYLNYYNHFYY